MEMKKLSAVEELSLAGEAGKILPYLLAKGLKADDAVSVANNTAYVYLAMGKEKPSNIKGVLELFSLSEIAQLCAQSACSECEESGYNHRFDEMIADA